VKVGICVVPDGLDMEPFGYEGKLEDSENEEDAIKQLLYHVAMGAAEKSWPDRVIIDLAESLKPGMGTAVAAVLRPNNFKMGDVFRKVAR
jgi:hypothetical protein